MKEAPKKPDGQDFIRYFNGMQILGYKAAKILRPELTPEEFVNQTAELFRALVLGEIFIGDVDWIEIRYQVNQITNPPKNGKESK